MKKIEDRPILSAAKNCSPGILGKIYADIPGGSLERGRQMRVGWLKKVNFASFALYIFRTFTAKATFIILCYVAPYWLFSDTEIDDLE